MYHNREILHIFLTFILIFLALTVFFLIFGAPVGHSITLNASWGQRFSEQFFSGDWYPRWLFGLNHGAGSPVFFYYAPMPFWIGAIFGVIVCSDCSIERWSIIGPSVMLALSGVTFYFWARLFSHHFIAIITSILYVFLPYHFAINFWYRSSLGEIAAYIWMPIILLGLAKTSRSGDAHSLIATAGYASLIYSHLPSALLFSPVMLFMMLIKYQFIKAIERLIMAVVLGIGLGALYIIPAISAQNYIDVSQWWSSEHYTALNWLWLDGKDAPTAFADRVLYALLITSLAGMLAIVGLFKDNFNKWIKIFIIACLTYSWFLMTYPSYLVWDNLDILSKVQFPWRVGIIIDISVATSITVFLNSIYSRKRLMLFMVALNALIFSLYYVFSAQNMYWNLINIKEDIFKESVRNDIIGGIDAPEYRTVWSIENDQRSGRALLGEILSNIPVVKVTRGDGNVEILNQGIDQVVVFLNAATTVQIQFRMFYYPGWRLLSQADGQYFEITASDLLGLIQAIVPPGEYYLVLDRKPIQQEYVGGAISFFSLTAYVVLLGLTLRRKRQHDYMKPSCGGAKLRS